MNYIYIFVNNHRNVTALCLSLLLIRFFMDTLCILCKEICLGMF